MLSDILGLVGEERLNNETVQSFLLAWVDGKHGNSARRYATTIKQFLASLREKKSASLSAIGHKDILHFIASREQVGVSGKTLSVDVRTLQAAFNLARKLGLVDANPVERALAVRPIAVSSSRRECFSSEQVTALLNAAFGDWKTMILLGYYTGARLPLVLDVPLGRSLRYEAGAHWACDCGVAAVRRHATSPVRRSEQAPRD